MTTVVTGSTGHLGEALVRTLRADGEAVVGVDMRPGPWTDRVGRIEDVDFARDVLAGARSVLHAATLHKPHVVTHSRQQFVDANISGTLTLLEAAVNANVGAFVFVSTTSMFGRAMRPGPDVPAVWVTEDLRPVSRNIYGVTKTAAEEICSLVHVRDGLPILILRTSRFFPEIDDDEKRRAALEDTNLKTVEFLNRRADIEDIVEAVRLAKAKAPELGFDRFIITATTPFQPEDAAELRGRAADVLARRVPDAPAMLAELGWTITPDFDRVYDNALARARLGWAPRHDFASTLARVAETGEWRSPLAVEIGRKGYHEKVFADGPFPVE